MRRAHAMRALGTTLFYRGRLDAACAALEQGIVLGDGVGDERRAEMRLYTDWPSVVCRVYAAICQWAQGHADRARASLATALERGARIDHVHTLSLVESFGAVLRLLYRDHAAALELADSAVALTRERSIANHGAVAALARGMTLIRLGQLETGRIEIERGWLVWHATGSCLIDTLWRAFRAELELAAGRPDAARGELDLAFEDMRGREERFYEAELLRLRARLELVQGDTAAAERALTAALEVARAQAARTFELRAATDLARLWQQQGRVGGARELLAPIHAWFSEGHDLPDLVEAGRLLAELGA
jgi:tetratricopeptide (TPR) repeat protein